MSLQEPALTASVNKSIWTPHLGPQRNAFLCDCEEVMFGGGRGCVHPDTKLDTPNGKCKIKNWKGGMIFTKIGGRKAVTYATPSVEGSVEDMYEVITSSGKSVECTHEHKFSTPSGWKTLSELSIYSQLSCLQDYTQEEYETFLYAPQRMIHVWKRLGDRVLYGIDNLCTILTRVSSWAFRRVLDAQSYVGKGTHITYKFFGSLLGFPLTCLPSPLNKSLYTPVLSDITDEYIVSIRKVNRLAYWDVHVPETNCYFANGILHHNSGKSALLYGKVLQHVHKNRGKSNMIFFRENFDDLADLIDKGKDILEANGLATFVSGQTRTFRFNPPFEGAWLKMRQIEHIDDLKKYKGHEYTLIGFDEICDFKLPFDTISDTFMACLRNPHGIKSQILYTGNPGGYNHTAVKRYFIDPWASGNRIIKNEFGQERCFFQSTVDDNPSLTSDPTYMRQLERIKDPALRKAWRYGDWSVSLGAMFSDVWSPRNHVLKYSITSSDIPSHFERYRCFDWGSSHPFAYLRYFISTGEDLNNNRGNFPAGAIVFYYEYYGWNVGNKVNEGVKMSSSEVATEIKRRELADGDFELLSPGPGDNQIFAGIDGNPIYTSFFAKGIKFSLSIKSAGSIASGCELIRNRLVGSGDKPQMYFTKDCVHSVRTLPTLSRHKIHSDRLADYQEDHLCDCIRYVCLATNSLKKASSRADIRKDMDSRDKFFQELLDYAE